MCGIVGYVGVKQAAPILLAGLSKLEYRGYDSAGVALHMGRDITVVKAKGRLAVLKEKLEFIANNLYYPSTENNTCTTTES